MRWEKLYLIIINVKILYFLITLQVKKLKNKLKIQEIYLFGLWFELLVKFFRGQLFFNLTNFTVFLS